MPPRRARIGILLLLAATATTLHAARCPKHPQQHRQLLQDDAPSSESSPSSSSSSSESGSSSSDSSSSSSSPSSPEPPTPSSPSTTKPPAASPAANSTGTAPTIIILNCPGDPGCPNDTAPYTIPFNTSSGPTVLSLGPGNSTAGFWGALSGVLPRAPGGSLNSSTPAQPEAPRPDEKLPEELVRQITAGKLPAANLQVTFTLQGGPITDAATFELTYKAAAVSTTALVSGTPRDRWNLTLQPQPQQQIGRRLLQIPPPAAAAAAPQALTAGASLYAVLSIYTANPQLVWYRLSQTPVTVGTASRAAAVVAATGPNATKEQLDSVDSVRQIGCMAEYCARLLAAGIPVAPSSIQFNPSYSQWLFGRSDNSTIDARDILEAQIAANQAAFSQTRSLIQSIVIPIVAVAICATAFWQRRRLIACLKGAMNQDAQSSKQQPDGRGLEGLRSDSHRSTGSAGQPPAAQPNPRRQTRDHAPEPPPAAERSHERQRTATTGSTSRSHERRSRAVPETRATNHDADETRSTVSEGHHRAGRSQRSHDQHNHRSNSNPRAAAHDRGRPSASRSGIPTSQEVPISSAQMMYAYNGHMVPAAFVRVPSVGDYRASKVSRNANMQAVTDFDARARAIRIYQQQVQQLHRARSMGSQNERTRSPEGTQEAAQPAAAQPAAAQGQGGTVLNYRAASSGSRTPDRPAEAAPGASGSRGSQHGGSQHGDG